MNVKQYEKGHGVNIRKYFMPLHPLTLAYKASGLSCLHLEMLYCRLFTFFSPRTIAVFLFSLILYRAWLNLKLRASENYILQLNYTFSYFLSF